MRIIPVECYKFDELSEDAKQFAIEETINFILECFDYEEQSENIQKAIDEAEKMRTPWFTGSYVWDYAEEEVLSLCQNNEYTKDGRLFPHHLTK